MKISDISRLLVVGLLLGACTTVEQREPSTPMPQPIPTPPVAPVPSVTQPVPPRFDLSAALILTQWQAIPNWKDDEHVEAWAAFLQSCSTLRKQIAWQAVCNLAANHQATDATAVRVFFEQYFLPYQVTNADGTTSGLVTGYYEPLLMGSRGPSSRFAFPLYGVPDDLLVVDFGSLYPELKNMRLRGRLEGRRVVPYYSRAEIDGTVIPNGEPRPENQSNPIKAKPLFWVEDPIELFFLQIQGSGRIQLDNGEVARVGYADQNGHPYTSIGKTLIERGELSRDKASMQGIKEWARANPHKLTELLNTNPSYVFFREVPGNLSGPLGALGVPLTAGRSIAVDARFIPLGAPVFLATTWPNDTKPLNRLMAAQDTGGAIRGAVRADFFWGFGPEAGSLAGRMKQSGQMWVLLPKEYEFKKSP